MNKIIKLAIADLLLNAALGVYHIFFGIAEHSWWLLTLGVYYLILSIMRLTVTAARKSDSFTVKFTGSMLMILSLPLIGTVILAAISDRGTAFHMIVMIGIAAYTFTKITLSIINFVRAKGRASARILMLRSISLATAAVSLLSLQRSMLVSFEGMTPEEIIIMNACTGGAVCLAVFALGLNLVIRSKKYR
ncbi:MAG: hypothetical protein IKM40_01470 [Clostridia bacterium]|nr:hypothetical protein [Clostridia bacterium]